MNRAISRSHSFDKLEGILRYAWILYLTGSICLGASLILTIKTRSFLSRAHLADGVVIELIPQTSSDGGTTYAPVYSFKDRSGQAHRVTSHVSSYPAAFTVGEKIRVRYLDDQPSEAKIDGFFDVWGSATITGGIGAVHLFLAWLCPIWSRKTRRGLEEANAVIDRGATQ